MANLAIGGAGFRGTTVIAMIDKEKNIVKPIHDPQNMLERLKGFSFPEENIFSANDIVKKIFENTRNRWY